MRYITFEDSVIRDLVDSKLEWQEPVITEKKIFLNELPTPNVSLRYTLGIGFSFAIFKGITVQ